MGRWIICYYCLSFYSTGTRKYGKLFHFIDNEMTWPQAQNYCREHHTDLVSGVQQLQHKDFQTEAGSKGDLWIVLFREVWKWSDGSNFSFSYWDPQLFKDKECSKMCTTIWPLVQSCVS
uniref:C-type lectin domain-containing protein n=1 Tax=Sander lucioperca TaxID=283035 RepID=A0A8C9X4D6_SANLU